MPGKYLRIFPEMGIRDSRLWKIIPYIIFLFILYFEFIKSNETFSYSSLRLTNGKIVNSIRIKMANAGESERNYVLL